MFIFGWFRSRRRIGENEVPEHLASDDVLANELVATRDDRSATARAASLTRIWSDGGEIRETMPEGTTLWHGGTISTADGMDDARSLWCTRNDNCADHYDGWARQDGQQAGLQPYRLTLTTSRALELANFGGASLHQFTLEHCDNQHDRMKAALRDWCLANSFDGVLNINCGPDEAVICRPAQVLVVKDAVPL
ncbi:MAG: hypothetical protein CL544_10045 [Alcanivorax sp.]|nr:hypothetical protein [Alcanivorax sp.]|tara:strand:- start:1014 stop:1592 length:579 start_codon:yes stop_codon:yes gene_type:complete